MPGTPATTTHYSLPRYDNATDPANFAGQVNAISDGVDAALWTVAGVAAAAGKLTPQTTLPTTSLYDGQELLFQTAAMAATGVMWHLAYKLSQARWYVVGGAPLVGQSTTDFNTSTNVWTDTHANDAGGPNIVLPAKGRYQIRAGAWFTANTVGAQALVAPIASGGATLAPDDSMAATLVTAAVNAFGRSSGPVVTYDCTAAGTLIRTAQRSAASGIVPAPVSTTRYRTLEILPVYLTS